MNCSGIFEKERKKPQSNGYRKESKNTKGITIDNKKTQDNIKNSSLELLKRKYSALLDV